MRITGKKSLVSHDAPKKIKEPYHFDSHSRERVAEEHEHHTSKEADGPADLVLARKEQECLLRPDEQRNSCCEKHITQRQECRIKEEQHSQHEKQHARRHKANANFYLLVFAHFVDLRATWLCDL